MKSFVYRTLVFENPGAELAPVEGEYLFSKDAVITRLAVTSQTLFLPAACEIELRLNSEALLSQGSFAPFLLSGGPFAPKLHIPVKAGQRLKARWMVPPGRSQLSFAYREGLGDEDLLKESYWYALTKERRDGVTLLQPNIQKDYLWEGLFVYDSSAYFLLPGVFPMPIFPEVFFGGMVPRIGPQAVPSLIDDVVQVRDYPTEFVLDYLPVSSIGGRGPAHRFKSSIPVASQTVLNIGVVSKTRTGGSVTAIVLGTHVAPEAISRPLESASREVVHVA
ncbi:MAG: hypothetical protein AB1405_16260 [Bdellovibrionota bacterium]